MPLTMIGDSSQYFQSLRQSSTIKARMNTLSSELSSGRIDDLSAHLKGDVAPLALMDRELSMLDGYMQTGREFAQRMAEKQIVLSSMESDLTSLAANLITITPSSSLIELQSAETAGRTGFDRTVGLLNTRLGDRALFAGAAVDSDALASAADMMASILTAVGGATDAATITAAIDTWFDDPAGGFATMGYRGDTGIAVSQRIGTSEVLTQDGRADDPGVRGVLKSAAYAAVSEALSGVLDVGARAALLRGAGEATFSATDGLRRIAARIGEDEQRVEELSTRHAAQRTTIAQARNGMTLADPFDTASLLQSVQQQLELHYTATARMSRMSLANYL